MRCESNSQSSRSAPGLPLRTTISPSRMHGSVSCVLNIPTSSGKYLVSSFEPRLPIWTSVPSKYTMPRKPSHLGSYDSAPILEVATGTESVSFASMGSMRVSTVRSCSPRRINSTIVDSPAPSELAELTRLRLDIAYDGTGFQGWAKQPGLRTVQGE